MADIREITKTDIHKMTRAQLLELALGAKETLEAPSETAPEPTISVGNAAHLMVTGVTEPSPEIEDLKSQIDLLKAALIGRGVSAEDISGSAQKVGLKLNAAVSLCVVVTDEFGNKKEYLWPKRGDVKFVTKRQYAEIQENSPHLFAQGKLVLHDAVSDNPNVISDFNKFLDSLNADNLDAKLAAVTEEGILRSLFYAIEERRYVVSGEGENAKRDEVTLPSVLVTAQTVIMRRLNMSNTDQMTTDAIE